MKYSEKERKTIELFCKICMKYKVFIQTYYDDEVFVCGGCGFVKKIDSQAEDGGDLTNS